MRNFVVAGGVLGLLGVALGAFGAHSLKATLEANGRVEVWQTGAHYQLVHALGLLLVALLSDRLREKRLLRIVGWLWLAGALVFSGSLYLLAVTNIGVLGAITPIGGLCFLIGWVLLIVAGAKETH